MAKPDLEFINRGELNSWLKVQPIEWSQVIAARAALRVFPFALNYSPYLTLMTFRANFISWAARRYPAQDMTAASASAASDAWQPTPPPPPIYGEPLVRMPTG